MRSTRIPSTCLLVLFGVVLAACGGAPQDPSESKARAQTGAVRAQDLPTGGPVASCNPNLDPECVGTGSDGEQGSGNGDSPQYNCIRDCLDAACGHAPLNKVAECVESQWSECRWNCANLPN